MTTKMQFVSHSPPKEAPTMLLLIGDDGRGFCAWKVRMRDQVVVHLSSPRLDRELASGAAPESTPARALHAQRLVAPRSRRSLARAITRVLGEAHRRTPLISPALPLCRDRVRKAAPEFRVVTDHLLAGGPVP